MQGIPVKLLRELKFWYDMAKSTLTPSVLWFYRTEEDFINLLS
jgi:hypothetical protein